MSKLTCFDLLSKDRQSAITKEIKDYGYMTTKQIKDLIKNNQFKNKHTFLDPEFAVTLDCYIDPDDPIFIDRKNNQIYRRKDLFDKFPFAEFGTTPEKVFRQQEIGVFMKQIGSKVELDYIIRDASSDCFISVADEVKSATLRGHIVEIKATKTALTNFYFENDEWEDFQLMKRFIRGFQQYIPIEGGATFKQAVQALPMFLGAQAKGGQALLTDGSEIKKDLQDRQSKKKKSSKSQKTSKSCNKTTTNPKSKIDEIIDGVSNL